MKGSRVRVTRQILPLLLSLLSPCATSARAAVFQYAIPVRTAAGKPAEAFLWIPPDAKQVRGVVLAGMTLMEREFAKDPQVRRACADAQLAIVFLKCGLGAVDPKQALDDLATASGYAELSVAPLLLVGHSAGGPQAKALAVKLPARCVGLVQYRGGAPAAGADAKEPAVPAGVPALMMLGQFDEFGGVMRDADGREPWAGGRDQLAAYRAADPRNLGCVVVEPGAGHFAWSDRNAAYLATWIRKAAAARIPANWPADSKEPVRCRDVDPTSGWLTDLELDQPAPRSAAFDQYAGDRAKANWHFDKELADATLAYHHPPLGGFGRRDQFVQWKDPVWLDAGVRPFFGRIDWTGDGQTFEVHPQFAETYPTSKTGDGRQRWADAGKPAGHAPGAIRLKPVSGPVIAAADNTFRIEFDALAPATEGGRVTFMAFHPGDEQFRHAEQVGMLPRGFGALKDGKEQTITFAPLADPKVDAAPVELKAASDAGLPVQFYVASGPAVIDGDKLKLAEIPARAHFPIAVKVVACQFGRGAPPLVKTAKPVEQIVHVQPK
jgi:hypothetical protein